MTPELKQLLNQKRCSFSREEKRLVQTKIKSRTNPEVVPAVTRHWRSPKPVEKVYNWAGAQK